jgi:hypothetical protein
LRTIGRFAIVPVTRGLSFPGAPTVRESTKATEPRSQMPRLSSLKNALSDRQKALVRQALRAILFPLPHRGNLSLLALKHGTDKWGHGYMVRYQEVFAPLRKKPVRLLEVGIGKPGDPRAGGESLRMWKEFFPKGRIYGIDIEDKRYHEEERIKIFQGDQSDASFLSDVVRRIGPLDIIIDDGSHVNRHVVGTFRTLFPALADGGVYVVEDTQTSYWPQYGGNWKELDDPGTSMSMLKELADGLNHPYIPEREPSYLDRNVDAVLFFRNVAFVLKGHQEHTLSAYNVRELERARSHDRAPPTSGGGEDPV